MPNRDRSDASVSIVCSSWPASLVKEPARRPSSSVEYHGSVERSRFGIVLDGMSEAVLTVDASMNITLVNPACLSILGLDDDPTGRPLEDAIDMPEFVVLAQEGRNKDASTEVQVDKRLVLGRAKPLASSGGAIIVMHDVTEMRRLEMIRKDFVANVSHELRTPVSIVRANAETLLEGALDDPERARYFIEALYRNADRLSRIIADLLDLSQIEAGQYHLSMRGLSVREAFDRTIESLLARADSRRITLEVMLDEELDVLADRKALDQILSNLVENGIKYTPEGGRVRLSAHRRDEMIRFEVEDDGQGIPEEHWGRIFERFYRVDTGRSRDMGGTGLGLAIVKHLVESMSGSVGVEAGAPNGARFWIHLPRSRVSEIRAA
ncbi:MAG: ATP-binding protein [Myxococcota bacterium]